MKLIVLIYFLVQFTVNLPAQLQFQKSYPLNQKLKEISGLECIGDSLLLAHNDGGNDPVIFVLNMQGIILKECRIYNAKNTDWEDITIDNSRNIYIGDIGNNENKRKKVRILKISLDSVLTADSLSAEIFPFTYPEQTTFPAPDNNKYFDAESLVFIDDSLWVFTKCRAVPFDGKSLVYAIPIKDLDIGTWKLMQFIIPGSKSWTKDSFTAATSYNEYFLCITYNRLLWYLKSNDELKMAKKRRFNMYNQRESIAVTSNGIVYIGNENHWLFGKQRLKKYKL